MFISTIQHLVAGLFTILLFSTVSLAQMPGQQPAPPVPATSADVSDEEVGKFAVIAVAFDAIQADIDRQILQAVNEAGMPTERFTAIMQAQQNPMAAAELNITEEEMALLNGIGPQVQMIQMGAQELVLAAIEDEDMTVERFQQIAAGSQADEVLAERINTEVESLVAEEEE